jgi:hypothetical protein
MFNRRMRENRTYGGVGACRGAIPGARPDPVAVRSLAVPKNNLSVAPTLVGLPGGALRICARVFLGMAPPLRRVSSPQ